MKIPPRTIVKAFATSVGREKAREIVDDAADAANIDASTRLSKEEAIDLLNAVPNIDGTTSYVRIAANTLRTQIQNDSLDPSEV